MKQTKISQSYDSEESERYMLHKDSNTASTPHSSTELDKAYIDIDNFRAPDALLQAQALGNLLDTAVRIPFIGLRVGLDFLVGLIPGIGDTIMLLASLRIVHLGHKLNMPKELITKMLGNALLDFGLGFLPIIGDIVDLFYKANQRNVRIMETWWLQENKTVIDQIAQRQLEKWQDKQAQQDENVE